MLKTFWGLEQEELSLSIVYNEQYINNVFGGW